jgi:phenylalanine-4-hydroxylase
MLPTLADQSAGTGFLGAETGPQAGLLSVPKTGHKEEGYLMRFYWGTAELSLAAREERRRILCRELRGPTLLASSKDRPYDYKPRDFSYVSRYGSNRSV